MKTIQKLSLLIITLFTFNAAQAQSTMKAPVRFQQKNGITVIVAQNAGSGKIYARLTIENETEQGKDIYTSIIEKYMNIRAEKFNALFAENLASAKITMNAKEANTATDVYNFEAALNLVAKSFFNHDIAKLAFEELSSSTDKETLKSITYKDLEAYYHKNFNLKDVYITIAGDITTSQAKAIVAKAFANQEKNTLASL